MTEIAFDDEDALLLWIESRPHRDRTTTTRNYFIGRRYAREKKGVGANQHSEGGTKCSPLAGEHNKSELRKKGMWGRGGAAWRKAIVFEVRRAGNAPAAERRPDSGDRD